MAQTTETLAIWSLVLGIISFVVCPVVGAIAAIITGTKGKKAIRNSGYAKSGAGMATAGQILGWVNIAFSVIGIGLAVAIAVFVSSHKSYTSLNPGDCFNRTSSGGVLSSLVKHVSCDKPHQAETVGAFDYPAASGAAWPGVAELGVAANQRCATMARDYVSSPDPSLQLQYFYPLRPAWDNGVRKVVCTVVRVDGSKLTGAVGAGHVPSTSG